MNTNRSFGDISLSDYRRIVGSRRRWSVLWKVLGISLLCLLCTAAGDYTGLWTGKDVRSLSYGDALRFLEKPNASSMELEAGMLIVQRDVFRGLEALTRTARKEGKSAEYAGVYLGNISRRGVARMKELASSGSHQERVVRFLALLKEDLK